ncbi:MAG: HAD family hydrolase [Prevotella sp.]|jgi:HAD superfamily hydrolase (TIGR01509 family)
MIKGYIFDYGGTLDTAGCHWGKMLWHAYQRQQIPVNEQQFRNAYVYGERTLGNNPIIQSHYTFHKTLDVKIRLEMEELCTSGAWDADEKTFDQCHKAVLEDLYHEVQRITAHSRDVLEELHKRYPMVLVSNFYGNISVVLREFGLDGFFSDIVESAVVGIRKPNPRIFELGVERLGLKPEECVVVGDSFYKDIEPAHKAGCRTVWFKGEGWIDQSYDETIPDKIITDLSELLR